MNVKELKEIIRDLPDEMEVMAFRYDELRKVKRANTSDVGEEEGREGCINRGEVVTFIIDAT